jgi:hypothetical protein
MKTCRTDPELISKQVAQICEGGKQQIQRCQQLAPAPRRINAVAEQALSN